MNTLAFHEDGDGRHLTNAQIAEYLPNATAIARKDLIDPAQELFAQAGALIHLAKIEVSNANRVNILFHPDNGVEGPDEGRSLGISGDWATIASSIEMLVDLNTLDEWLEDGTSLDQVVGRLADWHGEPFSIVAFQDSVAIKVTLLCRQCKSNPTTVYARSGCHAGAFCYVYNEDGQFQADLRNQEYVCDLCNALTAGRVAS
jgi:hypothetical protein